MNEKKDSLKKLLLKKAVKFGDFTLVSGQKSNYYINCKMPTLDGEGLHLIADLMLDKLEGKSCDAVGGLTLGADPIVGAMIALADMRNRKLGGFIVRKEAKGHGTQNQIEGPPLADWHGSDQHWFFTFLLESSCCHSRSISGNGSSV